MAKKPSGLLAKLRRVFSQKPRPVTPKVAERELPPLFVARRGIHMTSAKERRERAEQGLPQYTQAEMAEWRDFKPAEVAGFLYHGRTLNVHSSNVASMKYDEPSQTLYIRYLRGGVYWYAPVDMKLAETALRYASKGSFVWDKLRIRGTVKGYKVPYGKL